MQLVESFLSIQGEGKFAGRLAIFMRFAGCNFNCNGFGVLRKKDGKIIQGCDTIKAVWISEFAQNYEDLNAQELFERVLNLSKNLVKKPIVVITGGEPLLHHAKPEFYSFLELLLKENFEIHFESNASILIDFQKFPLYKKCIFALSVKLENSAVSREKRLNFKALKAFKENANFFYKFVLDAQNLENDAKQIEEITREVYGEIFCMPMGENEKKLKQNSKIVAEFCVKKGYNYSDRLHIRLWDDKEGV